jgi:tetratricopeptide (TPR) repeat protein
MDILTIIGGLGIVVGIVASVVQILDYVQKRREKRGAPPPTSVPETSAASEQGAQGQKHLTQLRRILTERFDEGELRTLCFDLDVDYDSLPGDGKADKARELVAYLERRDRVSELIETGKRQRPDIAAWAQVQLDLDMDELRARRDQADKARREMRERQRVVNLRPLDVTHTFKDRLREIRALCDHLTDAGVRLVSIVGRGGMGKTALASRVLADLERGVLPVPGEERELTIDGILYLSARGTGLGLERVYADVGRMLGEPTARKMAARWADRDTPLAAKVEYLLGSMQDGLYLILLDNLEDELAEDGAIREEGLRLFVERCLAQLGGARLITTSREQIKVAAAALRNARSIPLREGLPDYEAVALLRDLDPDGTLGLRDAPEKELRHAVQLTGGIPRALEILAGILHQDPTASLSRLLIDEGLFGEQVVERLVAASHRRLGEDERRVMETLAVFDRPVEETAVVYLLYPWFPDLDVRASLRRLVGGYFVSASRVTGECSLHPLDRDYVYRQLPDPEKGPFHMFLAAIWLVFKHKPSKKTLESSKMAVPSQDFHAPGVYNRRNLELRAADFYASIRKPKSEWKSIEDLAPQLAEFEHRVRARDCDGACRVLNLIDYNYLILWGHYGRVVEMREKLLKRPIDPDLRAANLGNLGRAYRSLGQTERAIKLCKQALAIARGVGDSEGEETWLGNLGNAYRDLGQTKRAIEYYKRARVVASEVGDRWREGIWLGNQGNIYRTLGQFDQAIELYEEALAIAREIGDRSEERDRREEGSRFGGLGIVYCAQGQTERAIKHYERALDIAREIGHRRNEAIWLNNLGNAYHTLERFEQAIEVHEHALTIAREIGYRLGESYPLLGLGKALLATGKLSQARRHCAEARDLDMPETSYLAALMLGIVLLRQRKSAAVESFAGAAARCRAVLGKTANLYEARYALAASLVGQAVCDPGWADESKRAELFAPALTEYRRALQNCDAPGVVREAIRDLELIRAAGVEGLEPVFALLESAVS